MDRQSFIDFTTRLPMEDFGRGVAVSGRQNAENAGKMGLREQILRLFCLIVEEK